MIMEQKSKCARWGKHNCAGYYTFRRLISGISHQRIHLPAWACAEPVMCAKTCDCPFVPVLRCLVANAQEAVWRGVDLVPHL